MPRCKGTRQMGFTVISITVALIAALIPILFMPDIVGRLFREFGLTLVAAIVASALVSLTLTPMLCGRLLGRGDRGRAGSRRPLLCRSHRGCIAWYAKSLDWTLRLSWLTLIVAVALAGRTVGLYLNIPKGFLPTQDTGILRVRTVTRSNISFDGHEGTAAKRQPLISADPAVAACRIVHRRRRRSASARCW